MSALIDARASVLIEIGPHPALTPAIASSFDLGKIRTVTTLRRGQEDLAQVLETLRLAARRGRAGQPGSPLLEPVLRRVPLPLYPFRRDRHWLRGDRVLDLTEPTGESTEKPLAIKEDLHPLLGKVASRRAAACRLRDHADREPPLDRSPSARHDGVPGHGVPGDGRARICGVDWPGLARGRAEGRGVRAPDRAGLPQVEAGQSDRSTA